MRFLENENTELKEIYVEDIRKEIVAFANTNGGTIYVGVRDDGEIIGVDDPDALSLQIANSARDSIKPDVTMFLRFRIINADGKKIVSVEVQRGTTRPYYIAAKGLKPSGVFVRQGSSTSPASDAAIRQLIKETDGDHYEDMRSLKQNLSFDEAQKAFSIRKVELQEPQMRTLGLLNEDGMYTNLALLLSDQCPHIIKAATFRGTDQEEFQDRREFSGSLFKQMDDAYQYLDMRNQLKATFQGLMRTDTRDYPEAALREALLNAVVHRDYSFSASTLISVYDDRVEFVSYGGITANATLEDVLHGLSVCRNQKLANVFYRLRLIEAYGTGLKKIRDSYHGKDISPIFLAGQSSFKVVLPNMNRMEENAVMDRETEAVLRFLSEKGQASRQEVEERFRLSSSKAARLLKKLREVGKIESTGKGKNVRYTSR